MTTTNPSDHLLSSWVEVGSQMWKGWFDWIGTATRNPTDAAQPAVEAVTQRFLDNQQLLVRLLRLSYTTWQEMLPKVEAGQNWQQTLDHYNQQIRAQVNEFSTGTLKASQDTADLWQLYLQQTQKFGQLWASALGGSLAPLTQASVGGSPQPWLELNDLYWNFYEQTLGSLIQTPLLGPTRELNRKLLRAFDAWSQLYRASLDYQVVLSSVQVQSFEALMRELVTRAERGEKIQDWRQFQQLWGQVADGVFEQAFCSEANLKVRGRFLNALNTYRIQQQGLMEVWLGMMNLPLRSEVDEVHKTIYELRKEVKSLKQALARVEAAQVVTSAEPVQEAEASPPPQPQTATKSRQTAARKPPKRSTTRKRTKPTPPPESESNHSQPEA